MTFLKRLYPRRARYKKLSGGITPWLALCFLVLLSLYQVCLKSIWKQNQRSRAEQSVEAGTFSLLSEYEPCLLERYDLFYIDTSFRTGTERPDEICSHLWRFIDMNLKNALDQPVYGLELKGVNVKNLSRATDESGKVFYEQAVRIMKERTGVSLAEGWLELEQYRKDADEQAARFQEACDRYEGAVEDYADEEEELDEEAFTWDGLRKSFTLAMTIPDGQEISSKMIRLQTVPSQRTLSEGVGSTDNPGDGILDKQWFIGYLCEYLTQAQEVFTASEEERYLDYQLEYVIGGSASDQENLEMVIQRLLLLREGINYTFLLSHSDYEEKAELLAHVLAGLTGNEALIRSVKHLILLGWAYGESLVEVRQLLNGSELSLIKLEEDWQVPLSGLLSLIGNPGRYDRQKNGQEGIGYEDCLKMLLMLQSRETLAMRALDIIEGELQMQKGCEKIHLDHCVEQMTVQVWFDGIYLERSTGYE